MHVDVARAGSRFTVKAEALLRADVATAFATLTDYERLPRFVPDVRDVRVLRRERKDRDEYLQVEQGGEFRVWWFVRRIRVRMDVVHANGDEVRAQLVTGPAELPPRDTHDESHLLSFSGRYRVVPVLNENGASAVRLFYDAQFEPDFLVPRVIGTWAVRTSVAEQFAAMAAEIERRFSAR